MAGEFQERRRSPRVALEGRYEFRLGRRIRVRLVDISAGGALLSADESLPVGALGRLQVALGEHQFEGQVHVKREQPSHAAAEHLFGSAVKASQPRHQEALEQFLRRAGN